MTGLVFFVTRTGVIDVRQTVKGQFAVALEAFWLALRIARCRAIEFFVSLVAGVIAQGIDEPAPARNELQAGLKQSRDQAMLEGLMEIANFPQFFFDVALLDLLREYAQRFRGRVSGFQRL